MPDDKPRISTGESNEEDYELLPHKEIEELKSELQRLKEFEFAPSKKMQVSLVEVNQKLDRLIAVFDEALHAVKLEEGGLSWNERIKPLVEKLNKILDQNASIAEGMVAIADMVKELKEGSAPDLEESPRILPPPILPPPRLPPIPPPPLPPRR